MWYSNLRTPQITLSFTQCWLTSCAKNHELLEDDTKLREYKDDITISHKWYHLNVYTLDWN